MKISVLGAGYVGLVTAACFAELGNEVMAADIDAAKIERLKKGDIPIYEPGLAEIVTRNEKEGRLRFTTSVPETVKFGEVIFVAVGTPEGHNGEPDLKYIEAAIEDIAVNLDRPRQIIVMKSTVPVGTSKRMRELIAAKRGKEIEFAVVSNPEFLKEGDAINDFMRPDRIVIGVEEPWAKEIMESLYATFTKNGHQIFIMDPESSELTKYAANTFLAARISLMNELAAIAELLNADIELVRRAIAADARIGRHFLYPGIGYGGSCFPKDVTALAAIARKAGHDAKFVVVVDEVNKAQQERFVGKILKNLGDAAGKRIAVWGLAFKPKTDDMRQAPSIPVIEKILSAGAQVAVYDPAAMAGARKIFGERVNYEEDMYAALKDASALVLITEWPQFKEPDFQKMAALMKEKNVFDGRNIYEPERMQELGFRYFGIGRKSRNA